MRHALTRLVLGAGRYRVLTRRFAMRQAPQTPGGAGRTGDPRLGRACRCGQDAAHAWEQHPVSWRSRAEDRWLERWMRSTQDLARLQLTSAHTDAQVDRLCQVLGEVAERFKLRAA